MTQRYLGGERPAPRSAGQSPLREAWSETVQVYREAFESNRLHDVLTELWTYIGVANKAVDSEQPWVLAKAWKAGDTEAGERLRGVLGDLVEGCRLVGLAAAPFLPATAARLLGQLGYACDYAADGNGGPPLLDELVWAAHAAEPGRLTAPEPLFPRLDVEAAETAVS
jgi:methionyl-tRNA synthetase